MTYENLDVQVQDGVAVVTVRRPEKLNALNDATLEELRQAFEALRDAPEAGGLLPRRASGGSHERHGPQRF